MTLRSLLLSTVYRNTPDDGAGAAPAAKPDDAAAGASAAPAPAADAAGAPEPAAGGAGAPPAAEAPADEPAAAAPAAEAVVEQPKEGDKDFKAETLLTGDEPKTEDKPAAPEKAPTDEKPAGEDGKSAAADGKPGEPAPKEGDKAPPAPEPPKEAPVYAYEFADGIKIDDESLKPVNETFAKHGIAPDVAKELMGMHVANLKSYAETVQAQSLEQQRDVWAKTRQTWREEIQSDERLGGAGYQTTLRQAAEVRDRLVPKENMAAFNRMLLVTGVGDHPEFIRLMKSAHRLVGEPGLMADGGQPPKHNGQPGGKRRIRDTYKTA